MLSIVMLSIVMLSIVPPPRGQTLEVTFWTQTIFDHGPPKNISENNSHFEKKNQFLTSNVLK
jgi:hypothetical protein